MHLWARRWFERPPPAPVVLEPLPGFDSVRLNGIGWPEQAPGYHWLEVSFDAQREPPLECRIDGATVELERGPDGAWSPRRPGGDG